MKNMMKKLIKDETGQGLVEYALIVGLIALIAVAAITLSGGSIESIWNKLSGNLDAVDDDIPAATAD